MAFAVLPIRSDDATLEMTGRMAGFTRVRLDSGLEIWIADSDIVPVPAGTPAPEFALRDTHGQSVRLSQFRGKRYVLLDFWASW